MNQDKLKSNDDERSLVGPYCPEIGLALAGRLSTPHFQEAARELNITLLHQRRAAARAFLRWLMVT